MDGENERDSLVLWKSLMIISSVSNFNALSFFFIRTGRR
jgi:hypothetical protein